MKKFATPILVLAAAVLIGAGCATQHGEGVYIPQNTTQYNYENAEKFVLMDSGAQRSVSANTLQEARLPDGRLDVAANVRNRDNRRIQVQVNCVFKDEQGFTTGDETPFQNLILSPNATESVPFTAMNSKAKKYTIRVRQAQ